jgi:formamidopyrimidine-DNA glycosylase
MPELPEVETIVRQLGKKVCGKKLVNVEIYEPMVDKKIEKILPVKIRGIRRRAKSIIFELSNGSFLLIHLRMTGHFHYVQKSPEFSGVSKCGGKRPQNFVDMDSNCISNNFQKFIVSKFNFSDNSFLTHNSIRKFGGIKLLNRAELERLLSKLGPEPLAKEFKFEQFDQILAKKSKANIKTTLMDPKVISGVGNIYAQEALFFSSISPLRKIGTLTLSERKSLFLNLVKILQSAIKHQGSTIDNYSNLEGNGGFQNFLAVYNKQKCIKGHQLTKVIVGGRGTTYCKRCQR